MIVDDATRTSPTLLGRTADWSDQAAWNEFVAIYDPYLRAWCREYRLSGELAAEVTQDFWIELAEKMRSFQYDPSRRFRGWLRRSFHWRVVDAHRQRKREASLCGSVEGLAWAELEASRIEASPISDQQDDNALHQLELLELAEQVQSAVRDRVQPQSWQVFWHIAIDGWSTRQTADELKMSYVATHAAHRRVLERLAQEGRQRFCGNRMTRSRRRSVAP
jgi:RNA polymerase sigma-70 factor (ECF subfamily)